MQKDLNRRQFFQATAALGAGAYLTGKAYGADNNDKDVINVALLGVGTQGQTLMDAILKKKDKSVRFVAVCDIWDVNRKRAQKQLKAYSKYMGYRYAGYSDYQEMLDKETDLDAVIVATPDFWHAPHTIACLNKGLHVYCEKEMSNTLEGARKMVDAQKASGKLLQIGHQRRSNPRYVHSYEKLLKEANLIGRITGVNGQWNRSRQSCEDFGWPEGTDIPEATLNKYGFKDMKQFRNWRWYKGLGGGPIVDLGSHQIDIYSWFIGSNPKSVIASGGVDYWGHEWYDNVMAIYEYETKEGGIARAFYQTTTTNSANGYFESFMGDEGTLMMSETGARCGIYREAWVDEKKWEPWVGKGYIAAPEEKKLVKEEEKSVLNVEPSPTPPKYGIPLEFSDPFHQPHLFNFFNSIRGKEKLNCPGEIGYETAVTVLKVNEAIEKGTRLEFKPEEFHV